MHRDIDLCSYQIRLKQRREIDEHATVECRSSTENIEFDLSTLCMLFTHGMLHNASIRIFMLSRGRLVCEVDATDAHAGG